MQERSESLENFDDNLDINKNWEVIRENINISAEENLTNHELNQQKNKMV
jgi:hypothetical protein